TAAGDTNCTASLAEVSQFIFRQATSAFHASEISEYRMMPSPSRVPTLGGDRFRLNGLRFRIPGGGHIGRFVGERFAGFIGKLLVLCANFPDGVMPAVVPADARLSIHHRPGAVA